MAHVIYSLNCIRDIPQNYPFPGRIRAPCTYITWFLRPTETASRSIYPFYRARGCDQHTHGQTHRLRNVGNNRPHFHALRAMRLNNNSSIQSTAVDVCRQQVGYYAPDLGKHFATARSVRLSVPWRSCLGYRHAGCLQLSHRRPPEMCGLRTRPRTDVDPPQFLPLSNCHRRGGISSRRPGAIPCYYCVITLTPRKVRSIAISVSVCL